MHSCYQTVVGAINLVQIILSKDSLRALASKLMKRKLFILSLVFFLASSAPNEARDINFLTDGSLDNGKDTCMEIATATINYRL